MIAAPNFSAVRRLSLLLAVLAVISLGCSRRAAAPVARRTVAEAREQTSASCAACHKEVHAAWSGTDHALANRPVAARDREAFTVATAITGGASHFTLEWRDDKPAMIDATSTAGAGATPTRHEPTLVLGAKPLWQPLIPTGNGRWQPSDMAFDPAKKEWFNIFGDEQRRAGEWGHWTGRGMNWNSMCAHCHMTGYQKNYSPATDSYASTWVEHGVGCIQCHGAMPSDHQTPKPKTQTPTSPPPKSTATFAADRARQMQTCAPCHARNEPLTANFQPGDNYHDHFRVTLPVEPNVFFPDGQQRDEDFNFSSVLLSRMGHAGVTCLDCHDAHTTKTLFPATDNRLCLRCHTAPTPAFPKAPVIDPLAHSHHAAGSTGGQCVSCHMPTTTYMQRAPRHDHGWLKPDPLLTKELGIPNACNRCHTDRPVDWAIEKTTAWFGAKLDSHQRARTRAVAAAQARQPAALAPLLAALAKEEVPAWRATLLELAAPYLDAAPEATTAARAALAAPDPLERAAAVRALASHPEHLPLLRPLLSDPVRLVRLDAAWALSSTLDATSPARAELDAYFALSADQPGGRLRIGQDLANRNRHTEAETEMRRAAEWDPYSPGVREALGFVLNARGQPREAAAQFFRAAQLQPADAPAAYRAALAFAEAGQLPDAELAFRQTLERDANFDRAWYNLGLLLAQTNRLADSVAALKKAESLAPRTADYPYALATVLLRMGDREAATAAARRALAIDPAHAQAAELMRGR
ncbi:MAG: hypothetical protein RLZZ15_3422 [Verrucomicrobiota bacterium]